MLIRKLTINFSQLTATPNGNNSFQWSKAENLVLKQWVAGETSESGSIPGAGAARVFRLKISPVGSANGNGKITVLDAAGIPFLSVSGKPTKLLEALLKIRGSAASGGTNGSSSGFLAEDRFGAGSKIVIEYSGNLDNQVITGDVDDTAAFPEGVNGRMTGSGHFKVTIPFQVALEEVTVVIPPSNLSYSHNGQAVEITDLENDIVDMVPTVVGTGITYSWETTDLPASVTLDPETGVISGYFPTAASAYEASATVTATNAGGSVSVEITIQVQVSALSDLHYAALDQLAADGGTAAISTADGFSPNVSSYEFDTGYPPTGNSGVGILPLMTGSATSFSVTPALPDFLAFDTATGKISLVPQGGLNIGDPGRWTESGGTYTFTAYNASGSTSKTYSFSTTTEVIA